MRETCSDHSNVGDSTVILLVSAAGVEVEGKGGKTETKRERVREFASNLKKVTGFCLDLAEDGMS